jgi:hypothetical protein
MSHSLSPNSLYHQTTDCTEGGGLTREHCIDKIHPSIIKIEENKTDDTELSFRPVTEEFVNKKISKLNIKKNTGYVYITKNLKIGTTINIRSYRNSSK